MPVFVYRAVTDEGKIIRNRVEDVSRKNLIKKLRRNNIYPISINQVKKKLGNKGIKKQKKNINDLNEIVEATDMYTNIETTENKVSVIQNVKDRINADRNITTRDIIIFTENLYLLKKANFNNIMALSTIIDTTENVRLREIIRDILAGVEAGDNMYTTMEYYSDIFPHIYINMVKVGELSGALTKSLEDAINYLEESDKLKKRIRKILIPNLAMFLGILVLLIVGVVVIIPIIQNVFNAMGSTQQMPAITIWFSNFINKLAIYWYIPVIVIGVSVGVILALINTPKGRYNFEYFKYTMPIFGKLIFSLDFSRFTRAMLLNLNNGMRIQEALEVSKSVVKNYVFLSIVESSINNLALGQSWIDPFERSNLASPMIIEMLNVGMQTDLREMMSKLVEFMDMDIDNTLRKIMKLLPEIIYAVVGILLVFLVLVVLVPCINMYMGGWLFEAAGV